VKGDEESKGNGGDWGSTGEEGEEGGKRIFFGWVLPVRSVPRGNRHAFAVAPYHHPAGHGCLQLLRARCGALGGHARADIVLSRDRCRSQTKLTIKTSLYHSETHINLYRSKYNDVNLHWAVAWQSRAYRGLGKLSSTWASFIFERPDSALKTVDHLNT
jgi:hypothetical protein